MNSCPIPAARSPEPRFPCWGARKPAQLDPAPSPRSLISRWRRPLQTLPPLKVRPRLRVRVQPFPAANDLRHDLRGCDDGAPFVVSVHPPPLLPKRVQARTPVPAPLSTGGATRQL